MSAHALYNACFGDINVRFIHIPEYRAVFVCRDDLFAAIKSCLYGISSDIADKLLCGGLGFFADGADKKAAIINTDTIGPALNAHAAGNLLSSMADLHDVDSDALRESAFRIHTLFVWYISAFSRATDHFNFSLDDTLAMIIERLDRHNPPFIVNVTVDSGIWTAECDALGLVTEAESYDELTERAFAIAPELAELNATNIAGDAIRLRFFHEPKAHRQIQ